MAKSFKDQELSEGELLWIKEVYNNPQFDPRVARVKLREKLPKGFNPRKIDNRLLVDGRNLTILGVWFVDPNSTLLKSLEMVILAIKDLIIKNAGIRTITAEQISSDTKLEQSIVAMALRNIGTLGHFYSSSAETYGTKGYSKIDVFGDNDYDPYLEFENLETRWKSHIAR